MQILAFCQCLLVMSPVFKIDVKKKICVVRMIRAEQKMSAKHLMLVYKVILLNKLGSM